MKRSSLSSVGLIVAVSFFMLRSFVVSAEPNAVIYSFPENVTVPLGQETLVKFTCLGDGENFLWVVDGMRVHHIDQLQNSFGERGIVFYPEGSIGPNEGTNITIGINVTTTRNNNTMLNCFAQNITTEIYSPVFTLTIAGPPFAPRPNFRVVNATLIEVQWDKPFVLPEFDVRNYTLLIANPNSGSNTEFRNESIILSKNTSDPIRHYISNGGKIPKECVSLNFTIMATNDVGTSDAGSVTGGFPIAPSPIQGDPQHRVTFTPGPDYNPTLHINFTFPEVCDYHDAKYSVVILNEDGSLAYQLMEVTYDKDGPDNVEVTMSENLRKDSSYTAQINVSTAVNWTTAQFKFNTNISPKPVGFDGTKGAAGNLETVIIISSSVAAGLFAILLGLITVIMIAFIMRRRKLKQRNRERQRELETDEAVQRAAQAMVPNPIYSGNPIYEEIVDSSHMLKSLRNGVKASEATSKDEGYVAISADAVKYVSSFPMPEESKLVQDKYTTFPEDTYTVMNPVGTLSNQSRGPASELHSMHHSLHNGNGVLPEPHLLTETTAATTNGGHCAATAGSAPATASFPTQDEERYVMGAF